MDICGLQFNLTWENRAANFAAVAQLLSQATPALAPGSLLVLPELFASGFSMDVSRAADSAAAETEHFLAALAQQYRVTVLGGVARQLPCGRGANEALAFDPSGTLLCRYRKIHSFSPVGENHAYQAGSALAHFSWNGFRVAPLICYDLRVPEVFRASPADLFCVIASWPDRRQNHWSTLLQARAIENQAFVLGLNRCGSDPHASYAGGSLLLDPQGHILAAAGDSPVLLRTAISPDTATAWRAAFPALRDRRRDLFPSAPPA